MSPHLPAPLDVREMLARLLGREVAVTTAPPLAPGPGRPASIGVYVDDLLRPSAVACTDLALSAYVAAALGLLPPGAAEDAIDDRVLDEELRENLHEVLNVTATLLNAPGAEHVRLLDLYAIGEPVPPPVLARALTLGRRVDLRVQLAGYGSGRLSLVLEPD